MFLKDEKICYKMVYYTVYLKRFCHKKNVIELEKL